MSKIETIEDLRNFALETLERLRNGDIDTTEAATSGKLCDNVISTVKTQLDYSRMLGEQAAIPFMQKSHYIAHDGETYDQKALDHSR